MPANLMRRQWLIALNAGKDDDIPKQVARHNIVDVPQKIRQLSCYISTVYMGSTLPQYLIQIPESLLGERLI